MKWFPAFGIPMTITPFSLNREPLTLIRTTNTGVRWFLVLIPYSLSFQIFLFQHLSNLPMEKDIHRAQKAICFREASNELLVFYSYCVRVSSLTQRWIVDDISLWKPGFKQSTSFIFGIFFLWMFISLQIKKIFCYIFYYFVFICTDYLLFSNS